MKSLLEMERVSDVKDVYLLREIYDKVEVQIRSLKNLDIKSEMYGPLLIPVLMSKTPEDLNLIISRQFDNSESWDINIVLKAMRTKIDARANPYLYHRW